MTDRGAATRARLIEATTRVVREVGYSHASTRAIAEAAGVAEGTIYRHFPDKAGLFFAAALESSAPIVDSVSTMPQRAGRSTVEANLVDALVQLATLQHQLVPLELAMLTDPELAAERRQALAASGGLLGGPPEAIAAYLAAEQRLGRVRGEVNPTEAAIVFLAALFGLGVTSTTTDATLDRDRIASAVQLLVRGVEPVAGRARPHPDGRPA
jgi:AcrR family transcriptional regulator